MKLLALDHVQLAMPPGQEQLARDFYSELLGLAELPKPPVLAARGGAWFGSQHLQLHLGVEEEFRPARKAHPAVRVERIEVLADRLEGAGYAVQFDHELPAYRRFYVSDPFGNRLEFLEPVNSAPA